MPPRLRLVYITARGHSGSTLLEMLLGAHSRFCGVGELKELRARIDRPCRCGAEPYPRCGFWAAVEKEVRAALGVGLDGVEIDAEDPAVFASHNRALLQAIVNVSGAAIVVDSSKSRERLEKLVAAGFAEIHVIHLLRRPEGVVYSNLKRGRPLRDHCRRYVLGTMRTRELLEDCAPFELRYEELARHPRETVERVLAWLGESFETRQLDYAAAESHSFAGNAMRLERESRIVEDRSWRRLGLRRRALVIWWTLPTRFASPWLWDAHLPYWKGEGFAAWREYRRKRRLKRRKQRRRGRRDPD